MNALLTESKTRDFTTIPQFKLALCNMMELYHDFFSKGQEALAPVLQEVKAIRKVSL
jgi:hypothetical protein